ncbi:hypothetical protein VOLCADRAFT_103778 [Volvox carteri f. nagariensis]|uniref:Uncharacterized protein n=1 Tax=Volvox carteri f. nagariensis TaxID=3068 RepID=D8TP58_VOLCA|nr:uncharacterized protein VOLCADRAFT_103778 [Volvox carteri f. nagariensis]EFJ50563.1 hypothetical protein VOLCADRAFT_103778 [Volvox carteri f. nagariensis]|eukprot:XP_002948156.1 hypothetical protein VOLCADRAFT_103778 [Volvox carteri f. nagariensis]
MSEASKKHRFWERHFHFGRGGLLRFITRSAVRVALPIQMRTAGVRGFFALRQQKLAELRKAMEKERAKREALMHWCRRRRPLRIWKPSDFITDSHERWSGRAQGEDHGGAVGGSRSAVGCSSSSGGGGAAVAGMSCGTDEGPSLGDGAFNEADSHRSFLDALNEWRKANRGDTTADGRIEAAASAAVVTSSGSGAGSSGPLRPRNSAPPQSSSLEVQTEARPASRPSSAKPLSYFDKLVINASSRVAGHLAAGGEASAGLRPTSAGPTTTTAAATHKASLAAEASTLRSSSTTITTAAAATAGASPGLRTDGSGSKSGAADLLSILDRLEALERERQAASHKEDEDDEDGVAAAIRVTTATGMVLTKGTRLPDEVLMPPNEGR